MSTVLGIGTITGFEQYLTDGRTRLVSQDTGNRAVVRLDEPTRWSQPYHTPHPYMMRSDMNEHWFEYSDARIMELAEYYDPY